jgi:hypothetical protein
MSFRNVLQRQSLARGEVLMVDGGVVGGSGVVVGFVNVHASNPTCNYDAYCIFYNVNALQMPSLVLLYVHKKKELTPI